MGRILLAGFEPSPDSAGIEGRAREIRMAGLTDFLRDFPPSVAIIYTGYKNAAGRVVAFVVLLLGRRVLPNSGRPFSNSVKPPLSAWKRRRW